MKKDSFLLKTIVGILAGVILNIGPMYLVQYVFKLPLFMDTIGSITVAFVFGGVPALICAVLSEFAMFAIEHYISWIVCIYGFSVWAAIGVVCLCRKNLETSDTPFSKVIILIIISILMTIAVSITAGIANSISDYYESYKGIIGETNAATSFFRSDLFKMGFSNWTTNILSRIPSNLVERPITTFLSFGIAVLYQLIQKKIKK